MKIMNVKAPEYFGFRLWRKCGRWVGLAAMGLGVMVAGCRMSPESTGPAPLMQMGVVVPEPLPETPTPYDEKPAAAKPVSMPVVTNTVVEQRAGAPVMGPTEKPGAIRTDSLESNAAPVRVVTMTYKVQKGDTLTGLSYKYMGKASRWPEIVAVNPGLTPEKLKYGRTIQVPVVTPVQTNVAASAPGAPAQTADSPLPTVQLGKVP
jgi:phage tail protein X